MGHVVGCRSRKRGRYNAEGVRQFQPGVVATPGSLIRELLQSSSQLNTSFLGLQQLQAGIHERPRRSRGLTNLSGLGLSQT